MTGSRPPRVTLRIDRITSDRPGIDRAALEAALRQQIAARIAGGGMAALGPAGDRGVQGASLPAGPSPMPARLARAVLQGVTRRTGGTG